MISHRVPILLWPETSQWKVFFNFLSLLELVHVFCCWLCFCTLEESVCYSVKGSFVKCASVYVTHPASINRQRQEELRCWAQTSPHSSEKLKIYSRNYVLGTLVGCCWAAITASHCGAQPTFILVHSGRIEWSWSLWNVAKVKNASCPWGNWHASPSNRPEGCHDVDN